MLSQFGRQPWYIVHKAKASAGTEASVTRIPRSVSQLFVRVRGFNKFGQGEWSDEMALSVPPIEASAEVPITALPSSWVDVDLGGLAELKPDLPPAQLLATKEQLLHSLLFNMNVIKVAFTFYALAGVNDVEDDPSTMSMLCACPAVWLFSRLEIDILHRFSWAGNLPTLPLARGS